MDCIKDKPAELQCPISPLQSSTNVQMDCSIDTRESNEHSDQQIEQSGPHFPVKKLLKLITKISSFSEVVSAVLPNGELKCLLNASIKLSENRQDTACGPCQRFYQKYLNAAFTKILTTDALKNWKPETHIGIKENCEKLVKLCVHKLDDDSISLLEVLAMVFDPANNFHTFNAAKIPESLLPESNNDSDEEIYARPSPDAENPRGWLVDLINRFGNLGGFVVLLSRFQYARWNLIIPTIYALLRPFELCRELLTADTVNKYLMPIVKRLPVILDNFTDARLKKQAGKKSIYQNILDITNAMKSFVSHIPAELQEEVIKNLEKFKLRMMLKLFHIIENFCELLVQLILDMNFEEVDLFCECFQAHWTTKTTKERKKLLELIRQLAKDTKSTAVIHKLLTQFWNLARSDEASTEAMDQALDAHIQILKLSFLPPNRDAKSAVWFDKCFEEVKSGGNWVLPALKQIRRIFNLYSANGQHSREDREDLMIRLENQHDILNLIIEGLVNYMDKMRQLVEKNPEIDEISFKSDGRYNHVMQVRKRLDFLKFILEEGQWYLIIEEAEQIWQSLVTHEIFPSDRKVCFEWFSPSIEKELLDPTSHKNFFKQSILQLNPTLLTESGFKCFEAFFKAVNVDEGKLREDKGICVKECIDLVGEKYLWRIITDSPEEISNRGIQLFMEVNTHLGLKLKLSVPAFQSNLMGACSNRIQTHCNTLSSLTKKCNAKDKEKEGDEVMNEIAMEKLKIRRITKVLQECTTVDITLVRPEIEANDEQVAAKEKL